MASPSLARPTPLDYAGAGTVGSLIGYWMSRRWQQHRDDEAAGAGETKTA